MSASGLNALKRRGFYFDGQHRGGRKARSARRRLRAMRMWMPFTKCRLGEVVIGAGGWKAHPAPT